MKADLHVHSKYSTRPSQWILQKLGCPESFTEPLRLYEIAKEKGMSLVTITDHNTIAGALQLRHLPDTFVSEEITTYFPEDGCKIHVLAYDIDQKHHDEIQRIREDIYALARFLQREAIVHVVAHPLYSINGRLTTEHFEKLLLLFKNFELNGSRDALQSEVLGVVASQLTRLHIARLVEKHGIEPGFEEPWRKSLTGGSDDHSSLNIARKYTQVAGARSVSEFLTGIRENRAEVFGRESTPRTLSHNIYGIGYQFYKRRFNLESHIHRDTLLQFLDCVLGGNHQPQGRAWTRIYHIWQNRRWPRIDIGESASIQDLFKQESRKLILDDPELRDMLNNRNGALRNAEEKWFEFVNKVSNKVLLHFGENLFNNLSGVDLFSIFNSLGSAGALYTFLAPYFVSFSLFTKDRQVANEIKRDFTPVRRLGREGACVAHFTDTFYEINGVAKTLRQQVQTAKKLGRKLTVITCDTENRGNIEGIRNFEPVGMQELPVYREQKLCYPPILEMLNYCYENNFTHIHSATPGPIGMAALLIARILNLPINGTYHTALPQYAAYLTPDGAIEDLVWKYVLWYYQQMDLVFVPSNSTGRELADKGIPSEKIRLFPRGIDLERFHPNKASEEVAGRHGLGTHPRLLYVGRVSKEKNLELLARVFKYRIMSLFDASLTIVGDGPYLQEMKQELKDTPTVFTGYLGGEELSAVYSSCDLFVFPSTTDTFGNVVLEAQASGLPVIVTNSGGPRENIIPGKTGLVVKADNEEAFFQGIQSLLVKPGLFQTMGMEARRYMEKRSFDEAYGKSWEIYEEQAYGREQPLAAAV